MLPTAAVAAESVAEMGQFLQGRSRNDVYAYELFRRAIVDRDERAWEDLYVQYRNLVLTWIRRHPAYVPSGDEEACANAALVRFWTHIPPARFDDFPTVAALLRYLKMCVHAELLDAVRTRGRMRFVPDSAAEMEQAEAGDMADATVGHLTVKELWAVIVATTTSEKERVVAECALVSGMKAAEIYARHRELFADVGQVYRVKRNLVERLQRSAAIRALCQ
jgi:DNA-directed RNA polymerase specialized sigma24 family protein